MIKTHALLLVCILFISCSTDIKFDKSEISINDVSIKVEIANTPEKRRQGLMYRKKLSEFSGMLFKYDSEDILSFWMKNTYIPLSIAFIASDGTIKEILHMKPESQRPARSSFFCKYALEMNQGFFKQHNIQVGDKVLFSKN